MSRKRTKNQIIIMKKMGENLPCPIAYHIVVIIVIIYRFRLYISLYKEIRFKVGFR